MSRSVILFLASLVSIAGWAGAQEVALSERGPRFLLASTGRQRAVEIDPAKAPIFQRRVTLALEHTTVGEALAAVGRQAGIRLVYSRDVLNPARPARIKAEGITVAGALTEILLDSGVDVVLSDLNRVTLAPRELPPPPQIGAISGRVSDAKTGQGLEGTEVLLQGTSWRTLTGTDGQYRLTDVDAGTYVVTARRIGYIRQSRSVTVVEGQETTADFALQAAVTKLDELVTTGTFVSTEVKALPTPVTVISETDIAVQRPHTVQEMFRQAVPGGVSWDQINNPFYTAFSARGASTLAGFVGQMKVFVDGIELTNPSSAAVDPNSIERVEVVRGPQAAALYGSDAIGGVVQIFTKRGDASLARPQVSAEGALGLIQTSYDGFGSVLRQEYRASVRGAGSEVSYNLGAGYSHTGDYLPNGELSAQSNPSVYGGMRFMRGIVTIDVSGRHYVRNNPAVVDPRLSQTGFSFFSQPFRQTQQVKNQTAGARLSVAATSWWQHTVVLGFDDFTSEYEYTQPRRTTPNDTLLALSNLTRTKTSIGYSTSIQGSLVAGVFTSLVTGFDHWSLPYAQFSTFGALTTTGTIQTAPDQSITANRTITNNTGYFAQVQFGLREALYLTGGLRAEQNSDFGDNLGTPLSPRLGLSYAPPSPLLGGMQLKLRGSWGRAIRAPAPGYKSETGQGTFNFRVANPLLGPERQRGWDAGVDAVFGSRGALSVTYYDQTAEDLIQIVQLQNTSVPTTQAQNVGRVKNTGVEVEGTLSVGPLALRGQYAYTRARIEQLAPNYTGDLRVGDQTLVTPKHTAGGFVTVAPYAGTTVAAGLTYVGSWKDYDYVAEFSCFGGTGPCQPTFRDYIMAYPAFVKVNASVSQQITSFLSGVVSLDNLTNNNAYEVNNLYPAVGRTTTVAFRLQY